MFLLQKNKKMCDVNIRTKYTTRIVYKVVHKIGEKYYALYSGLPIRLGNVDKRWRLSKLKESIRDSYDFNVFTSDEWSYNRNIVGKTTGFALLEAAKILKQESSKEDKTVLKIKLGGEIWKGTGKNILSSYFDKYIVYAGSEILSFEEVK